MTCALCENKVLFGLSFCQACYNKFEKEISLKPSWIQYVKANSQKEFRRKRREEGKRVSFSKIWTNGGVS